MISLNLKSNNHQTLKWEYDQDLVPYKIAINTMEGHIKNIYKQESSEIIWLLEHPSIYTCGTSTKKEQILRHTEIPIINSGRGGQVTYHGPGQLVGYPIVDLRPDRCDVRRYMRDLEEVMIRTAGTFGVTAERVSGLTGVWVGNAKLGAIGVRISRWITSHGFAFNVMTDLEYFNLIVPCGIKDRPATSLSALLGRMVSVTEVEQVLTEHFSAVFDRSVI